MAGGNVISGNLGWDPGYSQPAQSESSNNSGRTGFDKFWADITGLSNTESQNTAAATLQAESQEFNAKQADIERQWQEYMSNTAYQRSVADLKAAGLNPWLAVGNGATANSGAAASSGIAGAQASNVNPLAAVGTAAAGIGILIKALRAVKKK